MDFEMIFQKMNTNTFAFFMNHWNWLAFLFLLLIGHFLVRLFHKTITDTKKALLNKNQIQGFPKYFLELNINKSLSWILLCFFWLFTIPTLALPELFEKYTLLLIKIVLSYFVIKLVYITVEAVGRLLENVVSKTSNSLDSQLVPFAIKTLRVFVVLFGLLIMLQNIGFNVVSLLAGLGIGGLALALAAQDTAANLFGSITIIFDRPFQVGDWIKVGDTEGIVEEIGFRSTRIRSFSKSLVTIPNGSMAKEKIDNLGLRPARRIRHTLGITYGTPVAKIEAFLDQIRYYLVQQPQILKEEIVVSLLALGDFNLQILVNYYLVIPKGENELKAQQDFLLNILKIAEEMKIEFAFPTQTVHLHSSASEPTHNP